MWSDCGGDDDRLPATQPEERPHDSKERARESRRSRIKALEEQLRQITQERDALAKTVVELTDRVAGLEDDRLRLLAEMDNVRKRSQRRLEEDRWGLLAEIARPLLDVADNLDRASQAAGSAGAEEATRIGVRMVHAQLMEILARYGVTPIDAVGKPFDFMLHEAIAQVPADEAQDNEIVGEVAKGYLLSGRLLRPSKVVVARADDGLDE